MGQIVLGAAAVSVIAAGLTVALRGGDTERTDVAADARGSRYIVAPFEIQSGDASVAWLREGSVNMLTLALGQWSDLQVVDYERTLSLLDAEQLADKPRLSLDDARALGRRAGAGVVLTGQLQTTPDSLLVVAKLYDVRSGEALEQAQDGAALGADPRPLFDRLARRLLNVAGGPTSTVELERATTSNLRAYRAYLDGVRHLQSWRMTEADSAFRVATAADSTFALAYHKRALALGWSEATGPDYLGSATRAYELADRLPARERALVEGHYYLVKGLADGFGVVNPQGLADFERAMALYADLIARDSLVAEAWYGWADANFHGRSQDNLVQLVDRTNKAVAGFHKTLQVDSSFHLAYAHLVELYGNASGPNTGLLLQADTTIILTSDAVIAKLGSTEGVDRIRAAAGRRGVEIARAWMRADPAAAQPVTQLARMFESTGQPDSAARVLREASARPGLPQAGIAISAAKFVVATADTGAASFVRDLLARFSADSLRRVPLNVRLEGLGSVLTAAAMSGNSALLRETGVLLGRDGVLIPEMRGIVGTSQAILTVAMGTPADAAFHAQMRGMIQGIAALPPGMAVQAKQGSASLLYGAYLATRDRSYRDALEDWLGGDAFGFTEFDALAALDRGDSAVARQIARDFTPPAELQSARFSYGGMRTMARAEVLARLGLLRQAAETYAALDPRRFIGQAFGEPGYVLWVRTLLDQARLWAEVGERAQAEQAYERFLAQWHAADGVSARMVQQARQELGRLRDAPAR
jgi:TolB-like protein